MTNFKDVYEQARPFFIALGIVAVLGALGKL